MNTTALSTFVASLLLVAACGATATALAAITEPEEPVVVRACPSGAAATSSALPDSRRARCPAKH
ncbi:MAG TPA: hypothetical protein VGE16_04875 [Albitalea sp.]